MPLTDLAGYLLGFLLAALLVLTLVSRGIRALFFRGQPSLLRAAAPTLIAYPAVAHVASLGDLPGASLFATAWASYGAAAVLLVAIDVAWMRRERRRAHGELVDLPQRVRAAEDHER